MAEFLRDEFQDVINTDLVNHTPDIDFYGGGWNEYNVGRAVIDDDDDAVGTLLGLTGNDTFSGVLINVGVADATVTLNARSNSFEKDSRFGIGFRGSFDLQAGTLNYYSISVRPNRYIRITRLVDNLFTVLSEKPYDGNPNVYIDSQITVNGNSIRGNINVNVESIGPITDTNLPAGQHVIILSDEDSCTNSNCDPKFRLVTAKNVSIEVAVSDAGYGNDINIPVPNYIQQFETINSDDSSMDFLSSTFLFDNVVAIDQTILNIYHYKVFEQGQASTEFIGVPTVTALQTESISGFDVVRVMASLSENDIAGGIDINPVSQDPISELENAQGSDLIVLLTFSIFIVNDGIITIEDIPIQVKLPDMIDLGVSTDLISIIHNIPVNESGGQSSDSINIDLVNFIVIDISMSNESIIISENLILFDLIDGSDKVIIDNSLISNDQGIVIEIGQVLNNLSVLETAYSVDITDINSSIRINDFSGQVIDVVNVNQFEIQRVVDLFLATDQVSITGVSVFEDDIAGTSEVNVINEITKIFDQFSGQDITEVVGNRVKRAIDIATTMDQVQAITSEILASDFGGVDEIQGEEVSTQFDPIKTIDNGKGNEDHFVYDGTKKVINILFSLKAPRILFRLNIDEEHDK